MKTVSIGDTHGVTVANIITEIIDEHDKFIFIGDYVDSFNVDNSTMKKNLSAGALNLSKIRILQAPTR